MNKIMLASAPLLLALALSACEAQKEDPSAASIHVCPPCPECLAAAAKAAEAAQSKLTPEDGPAVSVLYHLTDQYAPVKFEHKEHAAYAKNCEVCHHYRSEVEKTPGCRECHGLPFKDLNRPGLKGAYHRQCMLCHRTAGKGPLTCEGCHERRDPDVAPPPVEEATHGPSDVVLGHLAQDYPAVKFNHKLHTEMTDKCEDCHHHHGDVERTPPCRECHNTLKTAPGDKKLGLKAAYHKQCLGCHREKHGPEECDGCHGNGNGKKPK